MADVTFEQRGAVAWITINRPEARNVLGPRAFVELADAWDEVRRNAAVRVRSVSPSPWADPSPRRNFRSSSRSRGEAQRAAGHAVASIRI